jgi:hypothetical protein
VLIMSGVGNLVPMLFMKKNCWEEMKCGREPGGARNGEQRVCPAALDARYDGVHGGCNAGRACWAVAGTLCQGEVQGTFAQKLHACQECAFYRRVVAEEGVNFVFTARLHMLAGEKGQKKA